MPKYVGWPLVGAVGYGALCYWAHRAVYHPWRYPAGLWAIQGELGAEDVWLRAGDGTKLHAWWVARPGARIATLFLHGNAGNLSHRGPHIRAITGAGSPVLVLDYRGYGRSEGRPSEKGLYADALAAYDHLRAFGRPVVIHGESLGTAVAVELAARRPCAGVVLESPITSAGETAGRILPFLGPLLVWGYDSKSRIAGLRAPLLVIHGERDSVVPFDLGRALYDAAPQPKSFWPVAGADHNNLLETAGAEYGRRLAAFYESLPPSAHGYSTKLPR